MTAPRAVAAVCAVGAVAIGAAGLVGWIANLPHLTQFRSDSIPIAPNTATGFALLGGCLAGLSISRGRSLRFFAGGVAVFVASLTTLRLLEYLVNVDFGVDRWLLSVPAGTYGLAPVGKMAFFTAVAMTASGISTLLLVIDRPMSRHVGGLLGLAVALTGTTFALGFIVGAQLVGGGGAIPMAFSTATGFVLLGSGLALAAGHDALPLRPFVGTSVRARLLRAFLPFTLAAAVVSAWLANWAARADNPYRAITTAGVGVAAALASAVICVRIAESVGADLERAEGQLRQARDELEDRVVERTAQLSQANQELRLAQAQLVQAEKLAGLGQLVAGVAHEINNPLAFVNNNFAVLEGYIEDLAAVLALYRRADGCLKERLVELAAEIEGKIDDVQLEYILENAGEVFARTKDGLRRILQIVKDLREFARLDRSEKESTDLNEGVESTINIIRGRARKRQVEIEVDLATLPQVTCFPAKINQVVMNLISNAIDACHENGRVAVRTRVVEGGVELSVADDGCGIDAAIRDKIFDPFFTTKPVGQGTGLGLSISYGIVQDHGGRLEVASQLGVGTTFKVFLPSSSS